MSACRGFGAGTGVTRAGAGFSHKGVGDSDIVTEMPPPHFLTLPHFEENDLSRNSHPFTECSGRQDSLLYL